MKEIFDKVSMDCAKSRPITYDYNMNRFIEYNYELITATDGIPRQLLHIRVRVSLTFCKI